MNRTRIEWVKNPDGSPGWTFNPITGCLNNCSYCYARKLANTRLKERYLANKNIADYPPSSGLYPATGLIDPFYPRFWEDRLWLHELVGSKRKPKGIFVCDMSDLFGIGVPEEWTRRVLAVISKHPRHRFYLLTKQPQNLIKFSPFPDNCWVGVSAIDTKMYNLAIYHLARIEARVKYISLEPFLEWDLEEATGALSALLIDAGIKWAIIGAQTKPYKPPLKIWVDEITEACKKAGIPYFLKNNLNKLMGDNLVQDMPK